MELSEPSKFAAAALGKFALGAASGKSIVVAAVVASVRRKVAVAVNKNLFKNYISVLEILWKFKKKKKNITFTPV